MLETKPFPNTQKFLSSFFSKYFALPPKITRSRLRDYSFCTYAKFSEKLKFVSFSESFAYVLNEWSVESLHNKQIFEVFQTS